MLNPLRGILTLLLLVAVGIFAGGCFGGTTCEKVSQHVLDLSLATPGGAERFADGATKQRWLQAKVDQCEKRKMSADMAKCYLAAKSLSEVGLCERPDDPTCVADCNCSTPSGCPEGYSCQSSGLFRTCTPGQAAPASPPLGSGDAGAPAPAPAPASAAAASGSVLTKDGMFGCQMSFDLNAPGCHEVGVKLCSAFAVMGGDVTDEYLAAQAEGVRQKCFEANKEGDIRVFTTGKATPAPAPKELDPAAKACESLLEQVCALGCTTDDGSGTYAKLLQQAVTDGCVKSADKLYCGEC